MIGTYGPPKKNFNVECCEDNYFPKGKFKSFNSLFHYVYLVFSRSISIFDLFAWRYLWDVCNKDKCCVVTLRAADTLVASLACLLRLFTFSRISCLLQL